MSRIRMQCSAGRIRNIWKFGSWLVRKNRLKILFVAGRQKRLVRYRERRARWKALGPSPL